LTDKVDYYGVWDDFLQAWPPTRLESMTLAEYSTAGDQGCFIYWLEAKTGDLGSIWGGSAFKFGIFNRKSIEEKEDAAGRAYTDEYAWYSKYGETPPEAFNAVKSIVLEIARLAAAAELTKIEQIKFSPAVKWKIAFLYQDRNNPSILPVYSKGMLAEYAKYKNLPASGSQAQLNSAVRSLSPDSDIFELGKECWTEAKKHIDAKSVATNELDEYELMERLTMPSGSQAPLNQILFGPPGTGKTYATLNKALEILDPEYLKANQDDRALLIPRYQELQASGRIRFVTFHQSFSYEDFVEGIRAKKDDDGQLSYEIEDGVFKSMCDAASAKVTQSSSSSIDIKGRRIWKMSLGNTQGEDAFIYDECLERGVALLGYGDDTDFSGCTNRQDIRQKQIAAGESPADNAYSTTAIHTFVCGIQPGDLVIVSDGNHKFRAIGEITGPYQFSENPERSGYAQQRPVTWHRVYSPSLPADQLMKKVFSQMTLYELRASSVDFEKLSELLDSAADSLNIPSRLAPGTTIGRDYQVIEVTPEIVYLRKPNGKRLPLAISMLQELADYVVKGVMSLDDIRARTALEKVPESTLEPYLVNGYQNVIPHLVERLLPTSTAPTARKQPSDSWVLIIDEINRGNISRIFGELITLIEPARRSGGSDPLRVQLPYSRETFSVPSNLYLLGTMNTADRSLAGLDLALRRRFVFEEMPPNAKALRGVDVEGVDIATLLTTINERIEALQDADHCIGHSYFLPLIDDPTLARLGDIFRRQILPLLQEYFFDDWERIRWVLNDHAKQDAVQFITRPANNLESLFGPEVAGQIDDRRWTINGEAFRNVDSYRGIIAS